MINGLKNLSGLVNISIFSLLILLIINSIIYTVSVANYPYENLYNMIIITAIFLVFYQYDNYNIRKLINCVWISVWLNGNIDIIYNRLKKSKNERPLTLIFNTKDKLEKLLKEKDQLQHI